MTSSLRMLTRRRPPRLALWGWALQNRGIVSLFNKTLVPIRGVAHQKPQSVRASNGALAVGFGLLSPHQEFDYESRLWRDGEPLFVICVAYGKRARAVRSTVREGMHLTAMGYLSLRDGKGETPYLELISVGVDLEQHHVTVDAAESSPHPATQTPLRIPPKPNCPPRSAEPAAPSALDEGQHPRLTPWWSVPADPSGHPQRR